MLVQEKHFSYFIRLGRWAGNPEDRGEERTAPTFLLLQK